MRNFRNPILVVTLLLVGMVFYALIWPEAPISVNDSASFLTAAADLSDGRMDELQFRTLGYPLVLLLTGSLQEPTRALFLTSLALHFVAVGLMIWMLDKLQMPGSLIVVAAAVLVLPPYVEWAGYVVSENLTSFVLMFVVLVFLLWYRTLQLRWGVVAGLLIGYAALIRPQYQLLGFLWLVVVLIVGLMMGWNRLRWQPAIISGVVCAILSILVVAGYSALNLVRFDYFGLSPGMLGWSLATHTAPFLEQLPAEYEWTERILIAYRDADLVEPGSSHTGRQYFDDARSDISAATGLSGEALNDYLLQLNLRLIREAPLNYLQSLAASSAVIWLPTAGRLAVMGSSFLQALWVMVHFAVIGAFFLSLVVIIGGLFLMLGRWLSQGKQGALLAHTSVPEAQWFVYLLCLLIILYTIATSIIPHYGEARYRVPIDALIIMAAVIGLHIWYQWSRSLPLPPSDD